MNAKIEFEPGAARPLFIEPISGNGTPLDLSEASLILSVRFQEPDMCVPIAGVRDDERGGFEIDLNEIADLITTRDTLRAYFYISWGTGPKARYGMIRLKPLEGCEWQPTL